MKHFLYLILLYCSFSLLSCQHNNSSAIDDTSAASESKYQKAVSAQSLTAGHAVSYEKMLEILMENSRKLKQEKLTIDPDHNFTLLMATHHEGTLQLAEELLTYVSNDRLKEIAQNIVATKDEERAQLQAFGKNHKPVKGDTTSTKRFMKPIDRMGESVTADARGNSDLEFAQLLLHHHQTGLELIDVELSLGRNPVVREMAQKIRKQQENEIHQLENWLQEQQ